MAVDNCDTVIVSVMMAAATEVLPVVKSHKVVPVVLCTFD